MTVLVFFAGSFTPEPSPGVSEHSPFPPVVVRTTEGRMLDRLAPLLVDDPDGALAGLGAAIVSPMGMIDDVARDTPTHMAWGTAVDPDVAPVWLLDWLAQFAGVRLPVGSGEEERRDRIRVAAGFYRGTIRAMVQDVQRTLTGMKTVRLIERDGGPHRLTMIVRTSECPDPAVSEAAAQAQKPARKKLTFLVSDAPIWNEAVKTWDQVAGTVTWDNVTIADA